MNAFAEHMRQIIYPHIRCIRTNNVSYDKWSTSTLTHTNIQSNEGGKRTNNNKNGAKNEQNPTVFVFSDGLK